jgi:hypothetical protein
MKRGFTLIDLPVSPNNPTGIPITGIFFENSAVSVQHIIDGTSLTVCVSETVISDGIPGIWDGKSPTNGFVLALGGGDATEACSSSRTRSIPRSEVPSAAGMARSSSRVTRYDPGDSRSTERAVAEQK